MEDMDQIKEQLLQSLIDHMEGKMGEGLTSKFKAPLEVSVAAPDKKHLAEGLDHAKTITEGSDMGEDEGHDEDSDEARLMALLGDDDGDEEDGHPFK